MRHQLLALIALTVSCTAADSRNQPTVPEGGTDGALDAGSGDSESGARDTAWGEVGADANFADAFEGAVRPVAAEAAWEHSCITLSNRTAYCWGANNLENKLGTQDGLSGLIELDDVVATAPGSQHTCALKRNGTVWCVGANSLGQLGTGTTEPSTVFVPVEGISNATQLSVGDNTSCARLDDGTAKCWGAGASGSFGDGANADSAVPVVFDASDVEQISAGLTTVCARLTDGSVWCAGRGADGQLGNGEYTASNVPVRAGVTDSIDLQVGGHHTCSLNGDGTISCWGYDNYGQTGDGSTSNPQADPVTVEGITDAVAIGVGSGRDPYGAFSCAILADRTMRCWGHALYGQLGNGSMDPQWEPRPVVVTGLGDATSLAVGGWHAIALTASGDVYTWGGSDSPPQVFEPKW